MKKNSNFSASELRLREYVYNNERARRRWANENWLHEDGRLFSLGKVILPILSAVGIGLMFIVCLVRFANIPEINASLANNGIGTNSTATNDPFIYPFFALTLILFNLIVFGCVRFIRKNDRLSVWFLAASSALLMLFAFIRRGMDSAIFPDNSDYDGAPMFSYFEYCIFAAAVFGLVFIFTATMLALIFKDKRDIDKMTQNTMLKIIPSDSKTLLTEDEYTQLIDNYLAEQNAKKQGSKRRKK